MRPDSNKLARVRPVDSSKIATATTVTTMTIAAELTGTTHAGAPGRIRNPTPRAAGPSPAVAGTPTHWSVTALPDSPAAQTRAAGAATVARTAPTPANWRSATCSTSDASDPSGAATANGARCGNDTPRRTYLRPGKVRIFSLVRLNEWMYNAFVTVTTTPASAAPINVPANPDAEDATAADTAASDPATT